MAKFSDIPKPDPAEPQGAGGPNGEPEEPQGFERPFAEEEAEINARDNVPDLEAAAYHGPWGEIAVELAPHTELDPKAILASGLIAFGNSVSQTPYLIVGKMKHYPVEFLVLVGETARARKGTSVAVVGDIMYYVDPAWTRHVVSGLSTGEGLISEIQDDVYGRVKDKQTKEWTEALITPGVEDKRLLADCREFSQVFTVMLREGNTLSTALCDFWDCRSPIRAPVRTSRASVTEPRVSIIGGITLPVLKAVMGPEHQYSGFGNRFNWLRIHRPRIQLDLGPSASQLVMTQIDALRRAHTQAQAIAAMSITNDAKGYVDDLYMKMESREPNLLLVRGFQHMLRHAQLYALSLGHADITHREIDAACALCRVYDKSTLSIFPAEELQYSVQKLLDFLMTRGPQGATRTDISRLCFRRDKTSREILAALKILKDAGKVELKSVPTKGRPEERWYAVFAGPIK